MNKEIITCIQRNFYQVLVVNNENWLERRFRKIVIQAGTFTGTSAKIFQT